MKYRSLVLFFLICFLRINQVFAQPNVIHYQSFIYENLNVLQPGLNLQNQKYPYSNKNVNIRFCFYSITDNFLEYTEAHDLRTDGQGMITAGMGSFDSMGIFSKLSWVKGILLKVFWLKTSQDSVLIDSTLIGSVPLAMQSLSNGLPTPHGKGYLLHWNDLVGKWDTLALGLPKHFLRVCDDSVPRWRNDTLAIGITRDKNVICIGDTVHLTTNQLGGKWKSLNPSIALVDSNGIVSGVSSGSALIKYTFISACDLIERLILINVKSRPNVHILNGSISCLYDSLILECDYHFDNDYQWFFNGDSIPNGSQGLITIFAPGVYSVIVRNRAFCDFSGDTILIYKNILAPISQPNFLNQVVCEFSPINDILFSTAVATGATFTGLPAGLTGNWSGNIITISGSPIVSGMFTYTVTLTGGCTGGTNTATGTIIVRPNNTIALSSAAGTNAQTRCINTAITNITYTTTEATGANVTGLPAGVTGSWSSNTVTISGTPTVSGAFTYTVTMTGGCTGGTNTITGTITVTPDMVAGSASSSPTLCINTPLTSITHTTTRATGIGTATGLPPGVTASWALNTITISGTPTASGTFNYSIPLTGGCGTVNATGTIIVRPNNTIALSSAAGTNAQTRCINTAITNITYATTEATGANVTGLPAGVTGSWSSNTVTISGTPTVSGTFTYTVTLTGGCTGGTNTATGTIIVRPNNTIALSSAAGTNAQTRCINTAITNITYTTTEATGANVTGLPAGVTGSWSSNTVTISGTPTVSGTFTYTVTMTGGCTGGTNIVTGTIMANNCN